MARAGRHVPLWCERSPGAFTTVSLLTAGGNELPCANRGVKVAQDLSCAPQDRRLFGVTLESRCGILQVFRLIIRIQHPQRLFVFGTQPHGSVESETSRGVERPDQIVADAHQVTLGLTPEEQEHLESELDRTAREEVTGEREIRPGVAELTLGGFHECTSLEGEVHRREVPYRTRRSHATHYPSSRGADQGSRPEPSNAAGSTLDRRTSAARADLLNRAGFPRPSTVSSAVQEVEATEPSSCDFRDGTGEPRQKTGSAAVPDCAPATASSEITCGCRGSCLSGLLDAVSGSALLGGTSQNLGYEQWGGADSKVFTLHDRPILKTVKFIVEIM